MADGQLFAMHPHMTDKAFHSEQGTTPSRLQSSKTATKQYSAHQK